MLLLVEDGAVDMLVELHVLLHVPLLLDVLEVAAELFATRVALLESEVFIQLFVEELVDWRI